MPARVDSDVEMDSEEDRREKKKSRHRSRSRSRDKKKSKKHKKEKKRKRKRSESAGETEGEGGDTPTRQQEDTPPRSEPVQNKLPGIGKYDSEGSDDEQDLRRQEYKREGDREKDRDREKRGERKRKKRSKSRSRSRSRNRRDRSRSREPRRDKRDARDREKEKDEKERGRYKRDEERREDEQVDLTDGGSKDVISLSIEETNKLREKLGLKPLNITTQQSQPEEEEDPNLEGTLIPGDRDKTRHLPADHWGEKAKSEKLREKLAVKKDKRSIESKLAAVRGLADSDSDDDAENWVQKQKSKAQAKAEAEKRAKMMSELDDEFGVGDLVTEKLTQDQASKYTSRDLRGLRVEHSTEHFGDGETILTLKDSDILDDKYEDVLVNVNIMDTERTKKNIENIKSQGGYKAYDQEEVDELTGEVKKKGILYQYNEEIDGEKKDSFTLQGKGEFNQEENKQRELAKIRQKLKKGAVQTLETPELKLASDYYNSEEMAAFKKPKSKKKKIRKKMLKADDLLKMQNPDSLLPTDFGNAKKKRAARIIDDDEVLPDGRLPEGPNYDDLPVVDDLTGVRVDDDDGFTVNSRLKKAKKLTKRKGYSGLEDVVSSVLSTQVETGPEQDRDYDDLILDQTQEFCRGLGDNVTYEGTGLGEEVSEELLDFEESLQSDHKPKEPKPSRPSGGSQRKGGWEEVGGSRMDVDQEDDMEVVNGTQSRSINRPSILDDEALACSGMGAALKMAEQMGYLERQQTKQKSTALQSLKAKKYSVEDKTRDYEEDDRKRRGRDRGGYSGPTTSFAEKKGYKPEVTLEYVDDSGRAMNSKEAFRYLSHKFHGKTSGKIKTEKRQRKVAEDKLMQKMSSTDTPLHTLQKQVEKTKELATPYLVLSGNKQLSRLKK